MQTEEPKQDRTPTTVVYLVGCCVEKLEKESNMLRRKGVSHSVFNACYSRDAQLGLWKSISQERLREEKRNSSVITLKVDTRFGVIIDKAREVGIPCEIFNGKGR